MKKLLFILILCGCAKPMLVVKPTNAPPVRAFVIGQSGHKYSAPKLKDAIHQCIDKEKQCRLEYAK